MEGFRGSPPKYGLTKFKKSKLYYLYNAFMHQLSFDSIVWSMRFRQLKNSLKSREEDVISVDILQVSINIIKF